MWVVNVTAQVLGQCWFVCLLFISLFLSFSLCLLGYLFPSPFPLKGTTLIWMECITCLCVGVCFFNCTFLCVIISAPSETNFKGHCCRPTLLSYDNRKNCYS